MKRQRGRGGRKPNGQSNRHFESNGPDIKIRGTATHICDKYQQLARDAASSGDRVMAENYLQHAEHYFRVVQSTQPAQKPRERSDDTGEAAPAEAQPPVNGAASGQGDQPSMLENASLEDSGPMDIVAAPETEALVNSDGEAPARPRRAPRPRRTKAAPAAAATAETAEAREALDAAPAPEADAGA